MKRQVIILGISALAGIGMIWVQRKLSGPDAFTQIQMRVLVKVQEYADGRARYWHEVAAKAASMYLASRP